MNTKLALCLLMANSLTFVNSIPFDEEKFDSSIASSMPTPTLNIPTFIPTFTSTYTPTNYNYDETGLKIYGEMRKDVNRFVTLYIIIYVAIGLCVLACCCVGGIIAYKASTKKPKFDKYPTDNNNEVVAPSTATPTAPQQAYTPGTYPSPAVPYGPSGSQPAPSPAVPYSQAPEVYPFAAIPYGAAPGTYPSPAVPYGPSSK